MSEKTVEYLLDRDISDVNCSTHDKSTPLHILAKFVPASKENSSLLRIFLQAGADPSLTDIDGCTPLHYCAATGKAYWCEVLLKQDRVDIAQTDATGATPLHYACQYVQNRTAKLLIEHGSNVRARNKEGFTPLEVLYHTREQKKAPIVLE
jgi:ankyrin repeat protein